MLFVTKYYRDKNSSTKDLLEVTYWYHKGNPHSVHFHTIYELGYSEMEATSCDYIILEPKELEELALDILSFNRGEVVN